MSGARRSPGATQIVTPALGLLALALAVPGCRAVIGIEDLTLADAAADADAATADASTADARVDAPSDARPDGAGGAQSQACVASCHMGAPPAQSNELARYAHDETCICGGGTGSCQIECATSACAAPPNGEILDTCARCIDARIASGSAACGRAVDTCAASATCQTYGTCLKSCR